MGQGRCHSELQLRSAGRRIAYILQPGGQDSQLIVKDQATRLSANYLLQTNDEPPAFIRVKTSGWRTGSKDVLEKLQDPTQADGVSPNSYKFRLNLELETGDERYLFVNTLMWVGSGCRRGSEGRQIVFMTRFYADTMFDSHLRCISSAMNGKTRPTFLSVPVSTWPDSK